MTFNWELTTAFKFALKVQLSNYTSRNNWKGVKKDTISLYNKYIFTRRFVNLRSGMRNMWAASGKAESSGDVKCQAFFQAFSCKNKKARWLPIVSTSLLSPWCLQASYHFTLDVRESKLQNLGNVSFGMRNSRLWNPEYSSRNLESH